MAFPYLYIRKQLPGPGAQAYALAAFRLMPVTYIGPAVNAGQLDVFQPPQVYWPQMAPLAGLGGVVAGQLVMQPVLDPSQNGVLTADLYGLD